MIRKHSEVLRGSLALLDLALVAGAWLAATWLRFSSGWLPEPTRSFDLSYYPWLLLGILPIWHILLRWRGLYDGHRVHSLVSEVRRIVEVCLLGTVMLATLTFFGRQDWVSRLTVGVFAPLAGGAPGRLAGRAAARAAQPAPARALRADRADRRAPARSRARSTRGSRATPSSASACAASSGRRRPGSAATRRPGWAATTRYTTSCRARRSTRSCSRSTAAIPRTR